ncbi:unnamed protein product [Spirodela intermedia]|uniref:Transcription factor TFIIIC triple barrel domain-containing protein n=1 Tax=Spirodela intermedia TaxID=51605 RepID=A0A7I8LCG5_SPIIN|nr:unnamed protein product [Spirodela intermedia]
MEVSSAAREEGDEREQDEEGEEEEGEEEEEEEEEEEFLFLDLDDVYEHAHIPENVPYVLSGLDTLNPLLIIDDNLKLIGKYEETVGTCYIFSETENSTALAHQETGPSEANLFKDKSIVGHNQSPCRQVKPLGGLNKVLKFRMATEEEFQPPAARKKDTH